MFSSTFHFLRCATMSMLLLYSSGALFAQNTHFENYDLNPVQVNMSITNIDGKKALRISRDTAIQGADIPTFVRLNNTGDFSNGNIEVMLLSRLLPTADATARGFSVWHSGSIKTTAGLNASISGPPTDVRTTSSAGIIPRNIFLTLIINSTGYGKKQRENMNPMPTWG